MFSRYQYVKEPQKNYSENTNIKRNNFAVKKTFSTPQNSQK